MIPNENYNLSYASGQFAVGKLGWESVTIAGLHVPKLEVGLIDYAYWPGGPAGYIGLGYPANADDAWHGNDPTKDGQPGHGRIQQETLFQTMMKDKIVPPMFSLALERPVSNSSTADQGYIAFGGLPPVQADGPFTCSPILLDPDFSNKSLTEYTIIVDDFTFPGYAAPNTSHSPGKTKGKTVVDCGSYPILAPPEVAEAYSELFNPPAIYVKDWGTYVTRCDAEGPKEPFMIVINGTGFAIPGSDFVFGNAVMSGLGVPPGKYDDYCFSGLQGAGPVGISTFLLGRPFLENVVAVFDVGAREMRFAPRKY
ncbi:uncharacterized protein LTR77_004413 [Saxophila tyrrhenica]|uniref:Peptidase A1 domain-containing protein n=1 Tax=Saxophila tyrrhenica TaxID=1690608 RepID=A0AAV9PCW3_9PEZI|nr:hypothetical protein LTR77_004413 [Saxophila tyrrhenica]